MVDIAERDVKKHVAAVHVSNKLTLTQRKASNVLLFNAYDALLSKEKHRIRIKDLAAIIGCDSHNLGPLKEALRGLARTVLEWNILDDKGREEEWGTTTFLAQATIRGGYCTYAYSPELREKLYNPDIYARINLTLQKKFSSGHALALYENCVRFRSVGSTGWIDLITFRQLLGLDESTYYDDFRKLNAKVIKPAIKQINQTSDISLNVEYHRERRRIVALRFKVIDNPQLSIFVQQPNAVNEKTVDISQVNVQKDDKNNILFLKIISFGLTRKQTEKVIKQYDKDYIEEILGVVEKEFKAGKIDNIAAYTLSALHEDYRPKRALPKEKHKIKRECRETSRELLERLQRDFDAYRLQTALGNLSEQERKDLETQFVEKLDRGEGGDAIIRKFYNNHGFEHKAVISMFRYFARQRLLSEPKEAEFHDFVKQRGYDLDELQPVLSSPPQLAIPS